MQAAVDMMRKVLSKVDMDGVVVIGEGEKDEAPMLYCGTLADRSIVIVFRALAERTQSTARCARIATTLLLQCAIEP